MDTVMVNGIELGGVIGGGGGGGGGGGADRKYIRES